MTRKLNILQCLENTTTGYLTIESNYHGIMNIIGFRSLILVSKPIMNIRRSVQYALNSYIYGVLDAKHMESAPLITDLVYYFEI